MALIQTGSTLYADGSSSGVTSLIYACDGCEAATGDPYACIACACSDAEGVFDWSEFEGWTRIEDGNGDVLDYCADCTKREHGMTKLTR
jgi:hypothetical protein